MMRKGSTFHELSQKLGIQTKVLVRPNPNLISSSNANNSCENILENQSNIYYN